MRKPQALVELIADVIVSNNEPLSFIDKDGTRKLVNGMAGIASGSKEEVRKVSPLFTGYRGCVGVPPALLCFVQQRDLWKGVNRKAVCEVIRKRVSERQSALIAELMDALTPDSYGMRAKISAASDEWTDRVGRAWVALTVTWINRAGVFKRRLASVIKIGAPDPGAEAEFARLVALSSAVDATTFSSAGSAAGASAEPAGSKPTSKRAVKAAVKEVKFASKAKRERAEQRAREHRMRIASVAISEGVYKASSVTAEVLRNVVSLFFTQLTKVCRRPRIV